MFISDFTARRTSATRSDVTLYCVRTWRCCCCSTADERDPESEEVLAEQLLRLTSREYLDCLGSLLKEKRAADAAAVADEMEEDAPPPATHSGGHILQFSELGLSILRAPVRAPCSYMYMPRVSGQNSPEHFLRTDTASYQHGNIRLSPRRQNIYPWIKPPATGYSAQHCVLYSHT